MSLSRPWRKGRAGGRSLPKPRAAGEGPRGMMVRGQSSWSWDGDKEACGEQTWWDPMEGREDP